MSADPRLCGKRILVTGCGGPAGVAVIRELHRLGCVPVPADCDPLAAGLHMGFPGLVLPPADAPRYPESLLAAAISASAQAVIVTVGEELERVAGHVKEFARHGVAGWFPPQDAIAACLDKLEFADRMERAGVASPGTALGGPGDLPGPWVIKPRRGRGSRDVHLVEDPEDFATLLRRVPDAIVQTRSLGREFTVDCLIDRDGTVLGAVSRWREQTRGGISTRGTTFRDGRVDVLVADVTAALGLTAVCNIQGFVDTSGSASVVEVNPRFSGGLPISLAAGADLVGQYLLGLLGYRPRPVSYAAGVTSVRWLDDVVVRQVDAHDPQVGGRAVCRPRVEERTTVS